VYATIIPSGRDSVGPPHSPNIKTASGLPVALAARTTSAPSALALAFIAPMPEVMRITSLEPQAAGAPASEGTAIFRTGSASIVDAAKT
jgi:hypothetical protein